MSVSLWAFILYLYYEWVMRTMSCMQFSEQGCWRQDVVDLTHSYGRQESEPTQQHVMCAFCIRSACTVSFADRDMIKYVWRILGHPQVAKRHLIAIFIAVWRCILAFQPLSITTFRLSIPFITGWLMPPRGPFWPLCHTYRDTYIFMRGKLKQFFLWWDIVFYER